MVAGLYCAHLLRRFWLPQKPSKGTPPVLLVHGLFHNASAWAIFSRRLARAGLSDLHLVTYNSFTVTYWDIVDLVDKRVAEIAAQRGPDTQVALVGHSLGGLAIRGWLSSGGHKDKALAAVIIGAPNKGSKLAGLGVSRLAGSLMHQGPLIREIEDREQEPPCPALSIYSPMDNMIMPSENTRIHAPGWTEEHTPPLGHVAMLYSRRVTDMTVRFIQNAAGDTGASSAKR
jgi:triacylglycerol esterase/lipase EstA (alpha/beta hydrolase family)